MIDLPVEPLVEDLHWCLSLAQVPIVRPMAKWAEEEIVLPNGPHAKEPYQHANHPVSRLWFDEVDSGRWSRVASTGPTQNGKTLMCYVIPTLYHLFEMKETVIIGLPTLDMANDKWQEDFLPVIQSSGYADLLPASGEGSRGGQVKRAIKFRNGASARFMTAGGNDKKRSAFTSRVVSITEVDGMDESSETSREADKIEQIEARTMAFGRLGKQVYLECTVSIERGRIWQEVKNGTDSRILRPCPYCGVYVLPERENLKGWREAESEEEAAEIAHFVCPDCEHPWTDEDRITSGKNVVLVHRGQEVTTAGEVIGPIPKTQTLGFRWSAIDNPFTSASDLGAREWLASKDRDRENAEKKMRQFVWTLPYDPPDIEMTPLDPTAIESRTLTLKRGVAPDGTVAIAIGVDTGKRMLHWTATAIDANGGGHVIEYDKHPVKSDTMGVRRGLVSALAELAKYFGGGWQSPDGKKHLPAQVWIDSGWHEHTDAVYQFCIAANKKLGLAIGSELYRPTKGYGEGQRRMTRYIAPTAKKKGVIYIGNEFHIAKVQRNGRVVPGVMLVHVNSDNWKSELHQRLVMPTEEPLSLTLYEAAAFAEHTELCQHLTAEKQMEKFLPGKGVVIVWERIDRNNHWLDSTYASICAGDAILSLQLKRESRQRPKSLREMAGR